MKSMAFKKGYKPTKETREKLRQARLGKPSGMKGKVPTKEHRRKISEALKGRKHSDERRQKNSDCHKGLKYPGKKISVPRSQEWRNKVSKANRGQKRSDQFKINASELRKGKLPKVIQRAGNYGHIHRGWFDINGKQLFFRSKWEANYALYLDFLKKQKEIKDWQGEKDVFIFKAIKFGTRSYRLDFKVTKNNGEIEYHEVKGWMDKKSVTKLKRMRIYYPKVKIILIESDSYNDIAAKVGRMLKFY